MYHGEAVQGIGRRGGSLLRRAAVCVVLVLLLATGCADRHTDTAFHFAVTEGLNQNYLIRDGETAAHLLLRSGRNPRIVVAFPAGNSGTGVWFGPLTDAADWRLDAPPKAKAFNDSHGRTLHGIEFEASIATPELAPKQAVLSNVRVLRDYDQYALVPAELVVAPETSQHTVTWARDRLDGAPGYHLGLEVLDGAVAPGGAVTAGADGRITLRVTAATGDTPLTPLSGADLFNGHERDLAGAKNTLTFLSYREKFLAGSWRFDTYFGRDTLISMMLLKPVLAPEAIEAGIRSVLARLGPAGQVAHEESLSEFAILTRQRKQGSLDAAPIYDYNMIDENYVLAPVVAAHLLDDPAGAERAPAYLAAALDNSATTLGQALVRNLRLVATTTAAFARDPRYQNLIALQEGRDSGQWRDSGIGLGGGRYPYDVNAILAPAALEATARLLDHGVLDPFLSQDDRMELSFAAAAAKTWRAEAPRLFTVTRDAEQARAAIGSYAARIGVPATDALAAVEGPITFPGVALDAGGTPIPIMQSDDTFDLLFGTPPPEILDKQVSTLFRPFPLGLRTGAGMVVANPVFADPNLQARFTTHDYHGTVVWSWVQAALASGLHRQLDRTDLPAPVRDRLVAARKALWQVIDAAQSMASSELWSWRFENGGYRIAPFGASEGDVTESNAAQLWSSVYLAITPP
ncbi:hypothetical protein DFR70_101557 [Nocardia tenerifensis]|uniref:Uncharacterized protein n=1 Tax=Nocardia tenerifensis TaxID=228006 RepID=A0A318KE00_9NOCA|nr:hypothetical protein [Nocardia tenerifensis]PXX71135.1 hypothetical protein DFR70_101557 [Nocardia tenerifensis]